MTGARLRSALPAGAILALALLAAFSTHGMGDYVPAVSDDNARPVIEALAAGHVHAALHLFPAMGLTSLLLRVPFSALAAGHPWLAYRLGALACLLPLALLAIVLDRRAAAAGAPTAARRLLAVVLVLGPGTFYSVTWGHPEQVLMAVCCVAAVLAAQAGRVGWAGVLLGLAIGTKQDAIVAALPVLLAVGGPSGAARERLAAAGIAVGVAVLCIAPIYLADPAHYRAMASHLAHARAVYAADLWWPLRTHIAGSISLGQTSPIAALPASLHRGFATALAIPACLALLAVPAVRHRRVEPLALLALVFAVRVAVDPMNLSYYVAPALIAAVAWEATCSPADLPVLSTVMTIVTALLWSVVVPRSTDLQFVVWAVGTAPFFLLAFVPARGLMPRLTPGRGRGPVLGRPA